LSSSGQSSLAELLESIRVELWHPGGNTGFIAQVTMDPNHKNAIMVVTNVRKEHKHVFQAMRRIKEYYAEIATLPGIK
jgi:hypothetical protein